MDNIFEPLYNLNSYNDFIEKLDNSHTPINLTGVLDTQKTHLISSSHKNEPTLILTNSPLKAQEIYRDLLYFSNDLTETNKANNVYLYPAKDMVFYHAHVKSMDITKERLRALSGLLFDKAPIIVMPIDALLDPVTPIDIFKQSIHTISLEDTVNLDDLNITMVNLGYERVDTVESAGQFALRGGIFDFYDVFLSGICRIEFFDDEVDSIRLVDINTQRSINKLDKATIYPSSDLLFTKSHGENIIKTLTKEYESTLSYYEENGKQEQADNLRSFIGANLEIINNNLKSEKSGLNDSNIISAHNFDSFIFYFYENQSNLLNFFSENTTIYLDEPNKISEYIKRVYLEFSEGLVNRIEKGYLVKSQNKIIHSYEEVLVRLNDFPLVLMNNYITDIKDFHVTSKVHFNVNPVGIVKNKIDVLAKDLKLLLGRVGENDVKGSILILIPIESRARRITDELRELGIPANFSNIPTIESSKVTISIGSINSSFTYSDINLTIISHRDLFGSNSNYAPKSKNRKKNKISIINSYLDLNIGDFIVHDTHGIGIYQGIEKIIVDNIAKDYLKLTYKNGGSIFVAANQLDAIQKFIGGEGKKPKLNVLGGKDFEKMKSRTKEATLELARELVQLYSKRQEVKGFIYSKDTPWQTEFEEAFPYDETPDQLSATEEIKADMESDIVMDRLLCGDVGYGKTEVAIRSAFKALQDGKQVAILVPTTILAQQHATSFAERMKDYPVNIGLMSRFRTAKQQKEVLQELSIGKVDILIGTHRILSKDIKFHNLGLVVIDEEQRFGIAHKEKLKQMCVNVDVLSLSATPIPRTLHMSLSGIRDMSVLEDPPSERKPIQTFVMEYQEEFIRDAIIREIARKGQVYFLHNKVQNIERFTRRIAELVPEANVDFAHGQMPKSSLESVMNDFLNGDINVLVCTTIIETGLDIPNVNTIIINDADKMGLSQLYQLRGRVGRSDRIAYSYLMFKKDKVLDETAEKRLRTISEFTEFGSGFKIAMRDLEIRGAGDLLGSKQHGHMDAVGYDMYCKLLNTAVREEKGEFVEEEWYTTVDININAFIPTNYINNEAQRLSIYKKISTIVTKDDFYSMQDELEDRFGTMPTSVVNLLDIAYLKSVAHNTNITAITQKPYGIIFTFREDVFFGDLSADKLLALNKHKFKFHTSPPVSITYLLAKGELLPTTNTLIEYIEALGSV